MPPAEQSQAHRRIPAVHIYLWHGCLNYGLQFPQGEKPESTAACLVSKKTLFFSAGKFAQVGR